MIQYPTSLKLLKTLEEEIALRPLTNSHTMTPFDAISPFPTEFSTRLDSFLPFSSNLKLSSANSFSLEESKICRLGKG